MSEQNVNLEVKNNLTESVVDAEEIAGKVVSGVVNNLVKEDKTKISFVVDVESKAIVESMAEALDNFTVDKLMDVLPRLIAHVQNYKNLTKPILQSN